MFPPKVLSAYAVNACSTNTQRNGAQVAIKSTMKSPVERVAIAEL